MKAGAARLLAGVLVVLCFAVPAFAQGGAEGDPSTPITVENAFTADAEDDPSATMEAADKAMRELPFILNGAAPLAGIEDVSNSSIHIHLVCRVGGPAQRELHQGTQRGDQCCEDRA